MVRRGRPLLNLTPEERLQRRRSQLVASQRKRRAHKRLSQPSKASAAATPENQLPVMPPSLHPVYDAMIVGHSTEVAVSQHHGVAATNKISSLGPQSPLPVCHRCGSAPFDMVSLTEAMSASSAASLWWTFQFGTDTHMLSSRLASPMRSSIWADSTSANEPDDAGIDQESFTFTKEPITEEASSNMQMPLRNFGINPFEHLGDAEPETSSIRQKCDTSTFITVTDNIFFPGLSDSYENSFWMPTSPPEAGPTLTGATLCGSTLCSPVLCDDSVDLLTPWAGTKQVSLVDTVIENPKLLGQQPMAFTLLKAVANFVL
ncbi:hypothetical protein ACHAQJ_001097 [Trichoderma viride]